MKVDVGNRALIIHRGGEVKIGNVYSNAKARFFRVVIGIIDRKHDKPWNNIVCIHIDATGEIVGASCQPMRYMSEHQDLVGKVIEMPTLKLEWFDENHPH